MFNEQTDRSEWFDTEVKVHEGVLRANLSRKERVSADVDDIVQEAYRRIILVKRKSEVRSPKSLLMRIAENISLDRIRRKYASRTIAVESFEDLPVLDAGRQPDDNLLFLDDATMLAAAMNTLPPRCRTTMVLRFFENLSYKEIAERLDVSTDTVDTQLARGLLRCRKYFERQGYRFGQRQRS